MPTNAMPARWAQVEAWLKPKVVEAVPSAIKDWADRRTQSNQIDDTQVVLFLVAKLCGPGSGEEKINLLESVNNPNVCSFAPAAQKELLKWKENLNRCVELNIQPSDPLLLYRAMESIFSHVFDRADSTLNFRWLQLRSDLGLPTNINFEVISRVCEWTEAELGTLVVLGGNANTGLPLTANQAAQQKQRAEGDKKRVAATLDKTVQQVKEKLGPQLRLFPSLK
jgi:hypothetical protein